MVQQEFNHRLAAMISRHVQWCQVETAGIQIDPRPRRQQQLRQLNIAVLGCKPQRCALENNTNILC